MSKIVNLPAKYLTTNDLKARYFCSSRTIFRWMNRVNDPFPLPSIRAKGTVNRWEIKDVEAWEYKQKTKHTA